jgi:hypothetical protein
VSFATAAAQLASDPNGSGAGTFLPAEGGSHACRLLKTEPGETQDFGEVGVWNPGTRVHLYHAGLPRRPRKDDRITVGSTTYIVKAIRGMDARGFWSVCDVDPAS